MKLAVSGYDAVALLPKSETQNVAAGHDPASGQTITLQVPIELLEIRGRITLHVALLQADGKPVDAFAPSESVAQRIVIAVNGVDRVNRTTLPNENTVLTHLVKQLAAPFRQRYCLTFEKVTFPLAADDELRPGNQLAKHGNWHAAIERWNDTDMKKSQNASDKLFNLAAANEALAYEEFTRLGNVMKCWALLTKAAQLYESAMKRDPKEKYIQLAAQRLVPAKDHIKRARLQFVNTKTAEVSQRQAAADQERAQAKAQKVAMAERRRQSGELSARSAPTHHCDCGYRARYSSRWPKAIAGPRSP